MVWGSFPFPCNLSRAGRGQLASSGLRCSVCSSSAACLAWDPQRAGCRRAGGGARRGGGWGIKPLQGFCFGKPGKLLPASPLCKLIAVQIAPSRRTHYANGKDLNRKKTLFGGLISCLMQIFILLLLLVSLLLLLLPWLPTLGAEEPSGTFLPVPVSRLQLPSAPTPPAGHGSQPPHTASTPHPP